MLCNYGCGQEAKYQFKNGKWCCSKSFNSCPAKRDKHSIYMKSLRKDPNSIYNSISHKEKLSNIMKKVWENPNSIFNSILYKKTINLNDYKENKRIKMKKIRNDPNSVFNSISYKYNRILTIEKIKKKYPTFFKEEEMRYNPDKPREKEIQVHCKNHECENSKEKNGWFTPTQEQVQCRRNQIENDNGNDGCYFYCSQKCKDTCPLYGLQSDPYGNTKLPYTAAENQLWRKIVLNLDKDLCQFCGKPATDVHHIKPVKTHPHLALDPDNGISFCEECHYKIGHKTGTECSTGNLAKIVCDIESKKFLS